MQQYTRFLLYYHANNILVSCSTAMQQYTQFLLYYHGTIYSILLSTWNVERNNICKMINSFLLKLFKIVLVWYSVMKLISFLTLTNSILNRIICNIYKNLFIYFACQIVSNKRQRGWTNRAQILCGTLYNKHDPKKGFWIIKISKRSLQQNLISIKLWKSARKCLQLN